MMKLRTGVSLACAISIAAMVGCQAKAPGTAGSDESTLNRGNDGRVAGSQTGGPTNGATGTGVTGGQTGSNVGTGSTGAVIGANGTGEGALTGAAIPKASVDNTPSREEVLAAVPAMQIAAKAGGLYKSPDGRLQAVIPPGVLSVDTEVKFAPVDTSGLPASPIMTPGIMFALDLGGAQIKEGEAIIVKSRVDTRFVEEFQRSAPGKDLAMAGLSQEDGVWYLAMPVKGISGPNAQRMQANHVDGDLATVEMQPPPAVYGLKLAQEDQVNDGGGAGGTDPSPPTSSSPSSAPSATPSTTPTAPPTPSPEPKLATSLTDDSLANSWPAMTQTEKSDPKHRPVVDMTINALGHAVTFPIRESREASLGAANRPEYVHCFIGHGWCEGETVYAAIDGAITFNKAVNSNHLPPAAFTSVVDSRREAWDCAVAATVNVTANAIYESDDTTVNNRPAIDATLRTLAGGAEMSRSAAPTGTLTFPVGVGRTFKLYGSIDRPEYKESTKQDIIAAPGMGPVTVSIPKFSPLITVNFTADAPLPASYNVKVTYRLDGGADQFVTKPATSSQQFISFRALVPDDADHTLMLVKVSTDNFADDRSGDVMAARTGVHRNREYTFAAALKLVSPK